MSRDHRIYLADILECCFKIQTYVGTLSKDDFITNGMTYDAVVRNVELIGEAAKHLPLEIRLQYSEIPWREIIGMRNHLIHGYFGINNDVLWDVITNEIPLIVQSLEQPTD
jgi:uncharacterized protein with HEPN domain